MCMPHLRSVKSWHTVLCFQETLHRVMTSTRLQKNATASGVEHFVNETNSCVDVISCHRHLTLSPRHLNNIKNGLREILDEELNLYLPLLSGVPMAYKEVKIKQPLVLFMDDSPFVHLDAEITYFVFKPQINSVIKAVVNKLGNDYVGCLIHDRFNASVSRPRSLTASATWVGNKVEIGEEFLLVVLKTFTQNNILSIRGKFHDSVFEKYSVEKTKSAYNTDGIMDNTLHEKSVRKRKREDSDVTAEHGDSQLLETREERTDYTDNRSFSVDASPYHKHKKKKKKHASDFSLNETNMIDVDVTGSHIKSKKNSDMEKGTQSYSDQLIIDTPTLMPTQSEVVDSTINSFDSPLSATSIKVKKKKKKKHKHKSRVQKEDLDKSCDTPVMDQSVDSTSEGSDLTLDSGIQCGDSDYARDRKPVHKKHKKKKSRQQDN